MNAWMHELYKVLGLFIPLIVSNCLPLARLEAFAAKKPVLPSLMDGLFMGLGFTLALTAHRRGARDHRRRHPVRRRLAAVWARPSSSWRCA